MNTIIFFCPNLQFVLPRPSDDIFFDVYEFILQPNSQRKLSITWQPLVTGNIRKVIKIEQVDSNRKYDFIILGNCIAPVNKNLKVIIFLMYIYSRHWLEQVSSANQGF